MGTLKFDVHKFWNKCEKIPLNGDLLVFPYIFT